MEHQVGHGVVYPVQKDAGNNARRAVIHPAEKQSDDESVQSLRQVQMYRAEYQGRENDCHPMPTAAEKAEEDAEDGTAEDYFLYHRGENSDGHVAQRLAHDALEHGFRGFGHRYLQTLINPFGG